MVMFIQESYMTLNSGIIAPHKDCTLLFYLKRFTIFFLFHFHLIFMKTASSLFLSDHSLTEEIVV